MSVSDSEATSKNETPAFDPENAVKDRYSNAAQAREAALCCPVEYQKEYLKAIPQEVLERDYGCGDPSPFVNQGETVLDLGSGGGKLCFIASQVVGPTGRVIGVDCNAEMLTLARESQPIFAKNVGFDNVEFRCGRIQDLKLDLEAQTSAWKNQPVTSVEDLIALRSLETKLRSEKPLVEENSVDCVVSNCVLNLVRPEDRRELFREVFRVLKPGGRAAISDIVSDQEIPEVMRQDDELWSGCISGAWQEQELLEEFANAGFYGMQIAKRQAEPWQVVNDIEFRSMTVLAFKPSEAEELDHGQAVIYRGPFLFLQDDQGHVFERGLRVPVSDKTFNQLQAAPYKHSFFFLDSNDQTGKENAQPFKTIENDNLMENLQKDFGNDDSCCGSDGCC